MVDENEIVWLVKKDAVADMIKNGKRSDGRKAYEYRPIEIITDYVKRAEGSAYIKLGNTQILVGVKMDVGQPYSDSPNMGTLITNAELVPLASPVFQPGPPNENAIELARVVDRGIRESKMIDFEKLCITEGEEVWNVLIDIHVLDFDGNLIDAATLAAVKALWTAKMPRYEDGKVIYEDKKDSLPVSKKPVACTFARFGNVSILDPSLEEEKSMDGKITITTTDDGKICAVQKSGITKISVPELENLIDVALEKGNEIRKTYLG
ncbi:RNA-binding protein [Candidatus Micrarchaeota archaeon]|nr:MAG: RNA-binding protein [Candidatus Micrarchaeota archaeon]